MMAELSWVTRKFTPNTIEQSLKREKDFFDEFSDLIQDPHSHKPSQSEIDTTYKEFATRRINSKNSLTGRLPPEISSQILEMLDFKSLENLLLTSKASYYGIRHGYLYIYANKKLQHDVIDSLKEEVINTCCYPRVNVNTSSRRIFDTVNRKKEFCIKLVNPVRKFGYCIFDKNTLDLYDNYNEDKDKYFSSINNILITAKMVYKSLSKKDKSRFFKRSLSAGGNISMADIFFTSVLCQAWPKMSIDDKNKFKRLLKKLSRNNKWKSKLKNKFIPSYNKLIIGNIEDAFNK